MFIFNLVLKFLSQIFSKFFPINFSSMTHNLESTIFDISSYDPSEISNGGNNNNSYSHGFLTLMNLLNTLIGAEILGIANSMTFLGLCPSVALSTLERHKWRNRMPLSIVGFLL